MPFYVDSDDGPHLSYTHALPEEDLRALRERIVELERWLSTPEGIAVADARWAGIRSILEEPTPGIVAAIRRAAGLAQ